MRPEYLIMNLFDGDCAYQHYCERACFDAVEALGTNHDMYQLEDEFIIGMFFSGKPFNMQRIYRLNLDKYTPF